MYNKREREREREREAAVRSARRGTGGEGRERGATHLMRIVDCVCPLSRPLSLSLPSSRLALALFFAH